jgi:hypothetical protein
MLWGSGTRHWGSGTSTTLRPYLSSRQCFRLVDLIISITIEHLAILSKLIHCIATCIANSAAGRISSIAIPISPTTTSLRFASWSSSTFHTFEFFKSFVSIHFDVLQTIQVFYTPSFGHSHLNEFHGTPRGSSRYSNHPNGDGTSYV